MELIVTKLRVAFGDGLYEPQSVGDGEPAYGCTFIVEPTDAQIAKIDAAMLAAAEAKWPGKGAVILAKLVEDKKTCFGKYTYTNKNGEPYDGFEGMYFLRVRNGKKKDGSMVKPTVKDRFNQTVSGGSPGAPYSGCYVHASLDFWGQDNQFGRRLNCGLQGVMFAADGAGFSGAKPATDATFANLAASVEAEDFV